MNTNLTNPIPELLGEREPSPRTIRFPKDLGADLDELAKAQGQDFTTFTLYLLKAAVAEVKARRVPAPAKKRPAMKRAG
jgi:hypothetical protein